MQIIKKSEKVNRQFRFFFRQNNVDVQNAVCSGIIILHLTVKPQLLTMLLRSETTTATYFVTLINIRLSLEVHEDRILMPIAECFTLDAIVE